MRFSIFSLIGSLLIIGCSSSSDSPLLSENVNDVNDDIAAVEVNESGAPDSQNQNLTRMNFNITVPVYMSNELQVQLRWGDIVVNANWEVGQSWTATMDLPNYSENLLVVNFADRNGEILLGTYEQQLITTSNATDSYLIQADQFDTTRWDADIDGVSNLAELLAGNDPLIDESLSLEIRDSLNSDGQRAMVLISIYSQRFETSIPDDRPYFEDEEVTTPAPESWPERVLYAERKQLTIDIDALGNGTYYNFRQVQHSAIDFTNLVQEGTRTHTDSSVQWTGLYRSYSAAGSCNLDNVTYTVETKRLDGGVIKQGSEQDHNANCSSSNDMVGITYTVTGVAIDDSEFCAASAGTITLKRWRFNEESVISKISGATHWKVSEFEMNGQLQEEYLVPSIDLEFYCEHVGL
jgi:hypothetical protein